jgi:hypothetical protein
MRKPPHSKADLIDLAIVVAPTRACATALREESAEVLGKLPSGNVGWVLRVKNKWLLQVKADLESQRWEGLYLNPEKPLPQLERSYLK